MLAPPGKRVRGETRSKSFDIDRNLARHGTPARAVAGIVDQETPVRPTAIATRRRNPFLRKHLPQSPRDVVEHERQ
jgi:hypothetical protein